MARKSPTAVEHCARDDHLRVLEIRHTEDLGGPGELLYTLEALRVGLDDVVRVLLLSCLATAHTLPAALEDVCAHYRIGVFQLANRRWSSGAQLGAYDGCVFLAWAV